MKTKFILSSLFISSLFFFSCKKELEPQESYVTLPTTPTAKENPAVATSPIQAPQSAVTTTVANNTVGMNPAHGQPGHRCDIAVGQPLNTAVAKTSAPQAATQTMTQTIQPNASANISTTNTPTAKGMNPPHGQPGHRCDIAVGQPLNSPAAKTTTAATATPTTISAPTNNAQANTISKKTLNTDGTITTGEAIPTSTPAVFNAPTSADSNKNPAHGQPGHRCDIAVGQPLPKS
jgi:hypothetical protein